MLKFKAGNKVVHISTTKYIDSWTWKSKLDFFFGIIVTNVFEESDDVCVYIRFDGFEYICSIERNKLYLVIELF